MLGELFGRLIGFSEDATEVHLSDSVLSELAMSHGDLARLLRDALKAAHPGQNTYVWTRDVYDDAVVYELSTNDDTVLYQRSYAIVDGTVTFGDPVRVVVVTQYVPVEEAGRLEEALSGIVAWMRKHGGAHPHAACVAKFHDAAMCAKAKDRLTGTTKWRGGKKASAESERAELTGDLVPLVEQAVKQDGTATIRIISPGQGASGYYPADVLQRDGPKVFAAGTHIYLDHPSVSEERDRPERSVKDLAGSLTGPAEWKEDGLYAPVAFIDAVAPHINAIAAISGMSIRASGTVGEREVDGKKVRSIESIDVAHSVDVVTKPGANGKVMDLIEAARQGITPAPGSTEDDEVDKAAFEQAQKDLAEARKQIGELETWKATQERRAAEAALIREAHGIVAETLAGIQLPAPTRERLTGQLAGDPPTKDGALDREALVAKVKEAAAAEVEYLTSVTEGAGKVTGMGGEPPTDPATPKLEESEKRINDALAAL